MPTATYCWWKFINQNQQSLIPSELILIDWNFLFFKLGFQVKMYTDKQKTCLVFSSQLKKLNKIRTITTATTTKNYVYLYISYMFDARQFRNVFCFIKINRNKNLPHRDSSGRALEYHKFSIVVIRNWSPLDLNCNSSCTYTETNKQTNLIVMKKYEESAYDDNKRKRNCKKKKKQ